MLLPTVAASAAPAVAGSQGVVTPTSHWGGITVPDLRERTEIGLHLVSFTQFGKEVHPGTDRYTFTPYNDIEETLGFNFLTVSRTLARRGRSEPSGYHPTGPGPFWRRETVVAGVVSDALPVFLQNDVMHGLARRLRWPGHERLRPVPRHVGDTPSHVSRGPTKRTPLLELSEEFFVRLDDPRAAGGAEGPGWPFFVGGGFAVGTINQELFLHAGAAVTELTFDRGLRLAGIRLRSAGVGGMARVGLLVPGYHFPDLTAHYVNLQGAARATVDWWEVPTHLEVGLTSANGFFVARRTAEQLAMIRERGARPEDVYQAKSPMAERFVAMRVRISDFTLETYNDVIGGKDKGPTFGAHVTFDAHWLTRDLGARRE